MGQSSSGRSETTQTPGITSSETQTLQQKFSNSSGKFLGAMPVDSETKTRIAGDIFNALGGFDSTTKTKPYEEQIKYLKQGIASTNTGEAAGYTGS